MLPAAHSAFVAHDELHWPVVGSHANAPQSMGVPAGQEPLPSQLAPGTLVVVPWHAAERQTVDEPTNPAQLVVFCPLQVAVWQTSPPSAEGHGARVP